MKKEQKDLKNLQFLSFSMENIEIPSCISKKVSGKDYWIWGDKNQLPYYLYSLYERSSLMQSIVNTTVNFVLGNGIESLIKPNNDETWEDIIRNLSLDYLLYGGFAFQIFYNKLGTIKEIGWLDMRKTRSDEEHTTVYYSKEFNERKSSPTVIEFPIWKAGKEYRNESAVFFYTGSKRNVYPLPRYWGSVIDIETSIRISNYHLNAIRNNFNGNFIINVNNGIPTDDIKHEMERNLKDKFCGDDNAGKFMLMFNESKENAVTVERIQDDTTDKKYEQLKESTMTSIFTGFSAPQQLFGYALTGNVFNKNEYEEAFDLYNRLQVTPIQDLFTRVFDKVYNIEKSLVFKPFELDTEENTEAETEVEDPTKINPEA